MSSYVYVKFTDEIEVFAWSSKMAQLVEMPFIVFRLTNLIFTGQTDHLGTVFP